MKRRRKLLFEQLGDRRVLSAHPVADFEAPENDSVSGAVTWGTVDNIVPPRGAITLAPANDNPTGEFRNMSKESLDRSSDYAKIPGTEISINNHAADRPLSDANYDLLDKLMEKIGIGDLITTPRIAFGADRTIIEVRPVGWNFHWAGVVMKDAGHWNESENTDDGWGTYGCIEVVGVDGF